MKPRKMKSLNKEFEQRILNFEPLIHNDVEQKTTTQGIIISKRVESVLVTKQEIVVLLKSRTNNSRRCSYGRNSEVQ